MINIAYVVLGLTAGILSGMFGVGGGTILIPALVFMFGLTQHQAQGTTLAALIPPIGLLAAWRYWQATLSFPSPLLSAWGSFSEDILERIGSRGFPDQS